jgi:hypothetical protein
MQVKARYLQFLDESSDEGEFEPEISRPPRYGGRPFNGRGRGEKKVRVIDSDDDDDLELDDSEVVEDSDIFTRRPGDLWFKFSFIRGFIQKL